MFNKILDKRLFFLRSVNKTVVKLLLLLSPFVLFIFLVTTLAFVYNAIFWGRIYPGISISGINVGGLKPEAAIRQLTPSTNVPEKITLLNQKEIFEIPTSTIGLDYDYLSSVNSAYSLFRTGKLPRDLLDQLGSLFSKTSVNMQFKLNEEELNKHLSVISGQISVDEIYPSVNLVNENIIVNKGLTGIEVDLDALEAIINDTLTQVSSRAITIPTTTIDPTINDEQVKSLVNRAEKLLDKSLMLEIDDYSYELDTEGIFKLLSAKDRYLDHELEKLIVKIALETEREPQNSVFAFEDGKVKEFTPALNGVKIKKDDLKISVIKNVDLLETKDAKSISLNIPVEIISPDVSTEEVNDLGIKELLGRGTSKFSGSISSRIHNIGVASSQLNGILIPPEQTISFNEHLGDVSSFTGYKQAYIIQDGKTILGDGGGVCQVSTTLFRAALDAGLPISERRAHSYRVSYYEQDSSPGIDATVYAPTTDLKFVNNTPGHLLIQSQFDSKSSTLAFEIYGTSDGRIATITKPVVTNVSPPPEDLYTDDPTKPVGYLEQIDWKAWGAKVNFDYFVEKDGKIIYEKTFYSNFKPWQAKFLRGTAPI